MGLGEALAVKGAEDAGELGLERSGEEGILLVGEDDVGGGCEGVAERYQGGLRGWRGHGRLVARVVDIITDEDEPRFDLTRLI